MLTSLKMWEMHVAVISWHLADLSVQYQGQPQGFLARDHVAWFQSQQRLERLETTTKGRIVPGHDKEIFKALVSEKDVWT